MWGVTWIQSIFCCIICTSRTLAAPSSELAYSSQIPNLGFLDYDSSHLLRQHARVKRSLDSTITWKFYAFNKVYEVLLRPDPELFTADSIVETDRGKVDFDRRRVYSGHLIGKPGSLVSGILLNDGRFEGKITDTDDDLFVERAEKFVTHTNPYDSRSSHSTSLYRGSPYIAGDGWWPGEPVEICPVSTVISPAIYDPTGCGIDVIYKLSEMDMSAFRNQSACKTDSSRSRMRDVTRAIEILDPKYSDTKIDVYHNIYSPAHSRSKRLIDPTKTMCELYIQADYLYYEKWGESVDTVIEQITLHVEAANQIYRTTDFDGDGSADDIRFSVKRLKIWTDPTASDYPFPANYGVEKFLEVFSAQGNFDPYCLAYTMTHRDFNDGTLGLAWTASSSSSGGICTRNGMFKGQLMSLNTGIVTTLNFQQDVTFAISQLTFSHELGHNMGSGHDDEANTACSPGNPDGNFIMYPKATDGDKPNNVKFSSCSISNMNAVINTQGTCFKQYSSTVCGNSIVEAGEECDCGWEDECTETCCNPMKDNYDAATYTPCTKTATATCSPSTGACCDSSCAIRSAATNYQCRSNTTCSEAAQCDGLTSNCPVSNDKANGAICANGMVCFDGECSHSICKAYGFSVCQCTPAEADNWSDENLCKLCCVDTDGTCKPSGLITSIVNTTNGAPGQPCNNYQGFCDVFHKCRQLDPTGPLNSLQTALFSAEGQVNMVQWITNNWYVLLGAGIGLIVGMVLLVKFGSKHTPVVPPEHKPKRQAGSSKVHPSRSPPL